MKGYTVILTDTHPTLGGKTEILRPADTKVQAIGFAMREVVAAREMGIHLSFRVVGRPINSRIAYV
jgi:hypothetical protein